MAKMAKGARKNGQKWPKCLTCVSDKLRFLASSFLSAPTTYWFFSNACSNFSSWLGLKAVRILFGLRNGSKNSGKWGPEIVNKQLTFKNFQFDQIIAFNFYFDDSLTLFKKDATLNSRVRNNQFRADNFHGNLLNALTPSPRGRFRLSCKSFWGSNSIEYGTRRGSWIFLPDQTNWVQYQKSREYQNILKIPKGFKGSLRLIIKVY